MFEIVICIITAFFITYVTIPLVLVLSRRYSISDDTRNSNVAPPFGGIAIFLGIVSSLIFWTKTGFTQDIITILSALFIIFLLGVIDDLIRLSPLKKLFGQIIAIVFVIYYNDLRITSMQGIGLMYDLPIVASYALTIFTIIVITNAFNLIDGIDGLAATIGIMVSVCFMLFFLFNNDSRFVLISAAVIGSLGAFLRYNYQPALIYMGDTGSLLIGFMLSIFAIRMIESPMEDCFSFLDDKTPVIVIAVLIIPLFDSMRVFIIRVLEKRSPLKGDFSHLHHKFINLGFSHQQTTVVLSLINLLMIVLVISLSFLDINYLLLIIISVCFVISQILKRLKKVK